MRSPFKLSALLLTAAMAFGAAAQANAMDNGEVGTPQEISAKLRAEGQHRLLMLIQSSMTNVCMV